MANKSLFRSVRGRLAPQAYAVNEAGGRAYRRSGKQVLAQYAVTGCLGSTFYVGAEEQLGVTLQLCRHVEPEFIARTAIYARQRGQMKDMPALLLAALSVRSPGLMVKVFHRVVDSPKMLRTFVQIMRSGVVGRKSLGTLPKRMIRQWLAARSDQALFIGSIGNSPSLADIIRMVHPKPASASRAALYGYLIGQQYDPATLPDIVQQFENFKRNARAGNTPVPDVPFQMLTALALGPDQWRQIARTASWQTTRMNLNTFARHGVFEDRELTRAIVNRLRNPQSIEKARVLPYQLMIAYANASYSVPTLVCEALQGAMELALRNVPRIPGKTFVCLDVSGSMHSPITGHRPGATTVVRCLDVAALVAAAVLRSNPTAEVLPFESHTVSIRLNPRDTIITNAKKLASLPGGGTNCSAPLRTLNDRRARGDLVVFVSDNESWIDSPHHGAFGGGPTATMSEWTHFRSRNPQARLVCIDIQPSDTCQAKERKDIVNVGGFSDEVFALLARVASGEYTSDHWVRTIEAVQL